MPATSRPPMIGPVGCACLLLVLSATPALAGPLTLPGWDLVWQDEFNNPTPDTAAWELLTRQNSFNNEKQYYVPEQITTANGNLVITATDQPLANKAYRSGRMESWQEWSYGRFEARIKLPTTQGMWPAFWLLPRSVPWPSGGEIDIMENRGSQPTLVSSAYHWGADFAHRQFRAKQYTATDNGNPVNFHDSFHDYAVEWEPGILRFSVDGNTYHTLTSAQADILPTPKSIVLNLAVGGHFGGDPDITTVFPQQMLVDYVRVWQRLHPGDFNNSGQVEQGDLDLVLQNWGLDTSGGTSGGIPAGWPHDNANLGQIEQTELDRVLQNWGSTTAPDFQGFPGVPEPLGVVIGALCVGLFRPARYAIGSSG